MGTAATTSPAKPRCANSRANSKPLRDLYIVYATYWNLAAEEFARIRESPQGGMGHACEMETSILLARYPGLVEMDRARQGGPTEQTGFRVLDMLKSPPFFPDQRIR